MTEEQFDKLMLVLGEFGKKLDEFMMFWTYRAPYSSLQLDFSQTEFLPPCTCDQKNKTSVVITCPRHDVPSTFTASSDWTATKEEELD